MKVFSLNDYEWWAGADLDSVKADYLKTTGVTPEEAFDNPRELPAEEMNKLRFADEDGGTCSFQEHLDKLVAGGEEFPCFFATTEF